MNIDEFGRPEPHFAGSELDTLVQFLDYQRATLEWKTRGLDDEALRRSIHPTTMTLGGLLTHLAWVEDFWFGTVVEEQKPIEPWLSFDWDANPDGDWALARTFGAAEIRGLWEEAVERSRGIVAAAVERDEAGALDVTHPAWGGREQVSLRWVLVHMIEEYARHNGHSDLLREAIDGETGE